MNGLRPTSFCCFVAVSLLAIVPHRTWAQEGASSDEFFEAQVRPLLMARCAECHGEKKQEMSLRIDTAEGFQKGGESGPLVSVDRPEESRLLTVLSHAGDTSMPPDGKLADSEIAAIRQWVLSGAKWPVGTGHLPNGPSLEERARNHWAFRPVLSQSLPDALHPEISRTWIDRFIQQKLDEKKLDLSPASDRRTLLRRLTFDLTGLPPTREEVESFDRQASADAWERETDRLLASPHYGEKWGRHWLDVARYADTKGYVFISDRRYPFAYTYRNYVIESLNQDRPYDRFIKEQLAADTLADPNEKSALAAMGYLTVGRRFLNNGPDIIDDRIDVVTRGMLGLTVTCARCHDHKYDPVSIEDYYSLYGVFNSSPEPEDRPLIGESESAEEFAGYQRSIAQKEKAIEQFIARKRDEKEAKLRQELPRLVMAWHESGGDPSGELVQKTAVESGLSQAVVKDFITRWQSFLSVRLRPDHPVFAVWAMYQATPPDGFSAMTERLKMPGGMDPVVLPAVAKTFHESAPVTMRDVIDRYCRLLTNQSPDLADVRRVLDEPGSPVKISLDETVGTFDQKDRNELTNLRNQREAVRVTHPGAPPEAMVLTESPNPVDSPVFLRGNPNRHGPVVVRRYIGFLDSPEHPPFREGSGRKDLALKIASTGNPLTARVMVNRIWHWHFGRGLAPSTSDFGLRADPPTHPELLDELAYRFMESGWSMKDLHRQILSSEVYRQASLDRAEARAIDPENQYLWRFRPRRQELEEMRDSLLEATGELDGSYLGRSVPIEGEKASFRRAVYAYIDRQNLESFFRTFDFANPNTSAPLRFVTTVPQQALYLMNSPFVIDRCRSISDQALMDSLTSLEEQVDDIYWQILRRPAKPMEIDHAIRFILAESSDVPTSRSPWSYGWGGMDASTGKVVFQAMEHWKREHWQPRPRFPHPDVSHLVLNRTGGHPGMDAMQSAIRRLTVPADGTLRIQGKIRHKVKEGDGVHGRLIASGSGLVSEWQVHGGEVETTVGSLPVRRGEAIDFLVDPGATDNFDSFQWEIKCELVSADGRSQVFDSVKDYVGPSSPLTPWGRLAQVLLLSNEFAFID
jgi:hypothetical protein